MAKIFKVAFNHKGLIFLILIFAFFLVINCWPFFSKKDLVEIRLVGQEDIELVSKLPLTDESAKQLSIENIQPGIIGYASFSVKLDSDAKKSFEYEIYLEDMADENIFNYDYVKVYLTDDEEKPYDQFSGNKVPTYKDLRVSLNEPNKRLLYSGVINSSEIKKFKLRIWVADTYVLNDIEKEFKGKISIKTIS